MRTITLLLTAWSVSFHNRPPPHPHAPTHAFGDSETSKPFFHAAFIESCIVFVLPLGFTASLAGMDDFKAGEKERGGGLHPLIFVDPLIDIPQPVDGPKCSAYRFSEYLVLFPVAWNRDPIILCVCVVCWERS